MSEQEKRRKRRKKTKAPELTLNVGETFDAADAKDADFDLHLKDMLFQAKKGQAGTRTRGN